MIAKILKIELFGLFLFTTLAFFAFYFRDSLPDNALTISSHTEGLSVVSYFTFSSISLIGYYSGPWMLAAFFIFSLFYAFKFSRRDSVIDLFNVVPLLAAILICCYFLAPEFVGRGMVTLMNETLTPLMWGICAIISFGAFFAGSFRSSFKDSVLKASDTMVKLPGAVVVTAKRVWGSPIWKRFKKGPDLAVKKSKIAIPQFLKGEKKPKEETPRILEDQSTPKKPKRKFSFSIEDRAETDNESVTPVNSKVEEEDTSHLVFGSAVSETVEEDDQFEQMFPKSSVDSSGIDSVDQEAVGEAKSALSKATPVNIHQKDPKELERIDNAYFGMAFLSVKEHEKKNINPDDSYFELIAAALEEKLAEFGIEGNIVNVLKGPVVDTFELQLGPGVKITKVTGVEDDLSMALKGAPIRIVTRMVGRSTIGIEVPRSPRDIIYLDELLGSKEFSATKAKLPIALGRNAFGEPLVVDLASMPHLLVAGATGAGKSVFVNTLLVSLLVKCSPRQMKLILIDPKQLELAVYQNLPHLIMPVITDPKVTSVSLLWAVEEMENRYTILNKFGVRNLEEFNRKVVHADPVKLANIHQYYKDDAENGYELPYIVIIIDEFADLIQSRAGKEIEMNIARLAAKARAAGIHLVLATQRPSVDVITGTIKNNFPKRISFKVTSVNDSKTILQKSGAEKLLGAGDMLYFTGTDNVRAHSAYVAIEEIDAFMENLERIPQSFSESAMEFIENGGEVEVDPYAFGSHLVSDSTIGGSGAENDLLRQAVEIVCMQRAASASMLQRKLGIGYNRAATLIEELEEKGVVGPSSGNSKPRKVLISNPSEFLGA